MPSFSEDLQKWFGVAVESFKQGAAIATPTTQDIGAAGEAVKKIPGKVKDISNVKSWADTTAQNLYKDSYTGGWLDQEDAARHLLGIGELARITNPGFAKTVASANEWIFGGGGEDTKMDEHNNEIALKLYNAKSREELVERVQGLMKESQLKSYDDPTKPVHLK